MKGTTRILLIEDDSAIASSLQHVLAEEGHEIVLEGRGDRGLERARTDPFDLVVTDLKLPGLDGLQLVRELHAARPRIPIILMTAHGTTQVAIEATKSGAYDYLLKPFDMEDFLEVVEKAVTCSRLMSGPVELGTKDPNSDALIGNSKAMQEIYKEIGRVASKPVGVLIQGETGTGKELIARAIYQHSNRKDAPFVAINCAAIPETLLESELFGHERGSFTGAESRRIGRFEQADHGTIFLDEIGDMTPSTQVKLLRVLQERTIQRLGSKETIPVDVRVIAATHRDLATAMQARQFREDLYYRLSVIVIHLPPLRERQEDVPALVNYFLWRYASELGVSQPAIQSEAVQFLQSQPWPGNVRELQNAVRKVLLLSRGYPINLDHVRGALSKGIGAERSVEVSMRAHVRDLLAAAQRGETSHILAQLLYTTEREIFSQAIDLAKGNQAKAARWLGVSRLTMREKLTQFGLHPGKTAAKEPEL